MFRDPTPVAIWRDTILLWCRLADAQRDAGLALWRAAALPPVAPQGAGPEAAGPGQGAKWSVQAAKTTAKRARKGSGTRARANPSAARWPGPVPATAAGRRRAQERAPAD